MKKVIKIMLGIGLLGVGSFSLLTRTFGIQAPRNTAIDSTAIDSIHAEDIEATVHLMQSNYPGYQDKSRRFGKARLDGAALQAREQSKKAASAQDVEAAIDEYLKTFADGHLFVMHSPKPATAPAPGQSADKSAEKSKTPASPAPFLPPTQEPSAKVISERTFYIKVPSFMPEHTPTLEALLTQYRTEIIHRPFLIIDVRDNHGGANTTFAPLLPLVYEQPIKNVGVDGFATQEIIAAWERVLSMLPAGEIQIHKELQDDLQKLRAAPPGTFVALGPDHVTTLRPMPMPRRVVILINKGCTSSTEQFLLDARPSKKVALIGQTTYGALDYGDIRPFPLPSGVRTLWMPTTRSRRLPGHAIDGIGIAPDVPVMRNMPETERDKADDPELQSALRFLAGESS